MNYKLINQVPSVFRPKLPGWTGDPSFISKASECAIVSVSPAASFIGKCQPCLEIQKEVLLMSGAI